MKMKIIPVLFLLLMFPFLSGFALYHHYGPFMGKVIDLETKEPIEGAAVLAIYYTTSHNVAGASDHYANAQETLTNENGEFRIPPLNNFTFRPFQYHASYVDFTIFKPGYGVFGGSGTYPGVLVDGARLGNSFLTESKYVVIELPKVRSRQERLDNLMRLYISDEVPKRKKKHMIRLENTERKHLGL